MSSSDLIPYNQDIYYRLSDHSLWSLDKDGNLVKSIYQNVGHTDKLLEFFIYMENLDNVRDVVEKLNMYNEQHVYFFAIFMITCGLHICFPNRSFNSSHPKHFSFEKSKCLEEVIAIIANFSKIASKAWFIQPTHEQINNFFKKISTPLSCRFANTFGIETKPCYRLKRENDNANSANEWLRLISLSDQRMIYRIIAIYYACEDFVILLSKTYNLQKRCLH